MPYVSNDPERYRGRSIDGGQCVALVRRATGAPGTWTWRQGQRVKGAAVIEPGTAIATFFDGEYPSNASGNHAAIYLSHGPNGIEVMDQWSGHPTGRRTIQYRGGSGDPSNDGDYYYVVE